MAHDILSCCTKAKTIGHCGWSFSVSWSQNHQIFKGLGVGLTYMWGERGSKQE